jgi:plastocyanin
VKTFTILPDTNTAPRPQIGRGVAWARRFYLGFAALFWLGIVAQAFLAGAGLFVGGSWMRGHIALGHLLTSPLPLLPLLMLILSFAGRLPKADRWWCALLLILATLQPVVLYLRGVLPLLSALHPVNAMLLFVLPPFLIARARRAARVGMVGQSLATLALCFVAAAALAACGSTSGQAGSAPASAPGGGPAVHMDNAIFKATSATVQKGQSLTLIADTFAPHVIANGSWQGGQPKPAREPGAPAVNELNISGNGSGAIGPFSTAGTFQFYCTIHPKMNLTVTVQ